MMLDIFSGGAAFDLLERTADTPGVLRAVQLSLAPAFLLVGIGSLMNVMMQRLIWIAGRIERLCANSESKDPAFISRLPFEEEIDWLTHRRGLVRTAIKFATGAAVAISLVIALLFVSAYVEARIGTVVATLWIATMLLLITALGYFVRETWLAARSPSPHPEQPGK